MKFTPTMHAIGFIGLFCAFVLQTQNVREYERIHGNLLTALNKSNDAIDAANDSLAVAYDTMLADSIALKAAGLALAQCRGEELPAELSIEPSGEWPQDEHGTDIGSLSAEQWNVLTDATNIVGVTREPQ